MAWVHHQVAQSRTRTHLAFDLDVAEVDRARPDYAAVLGLGYRPFRLRPQDTRRLERIVKVVRGDAHRARVGGRRRELGQRPAVALAGGPNGEVAHFGGSERA